MKRSRSDIPTGASLFRELKLKRQRLSMLLNRDINDVLSITSSSDTGDHGSDVDAGPPLMLREDSACFESRRHDAVDSGASSDGDWSFCGSGYSTRHPLMLIPDHTRVMSSHAGQSSLFSGPPSSDRKTFATGKPDAESTMTRVSTQRVDFSETNISAVATLSETDKTSLSRFRSGASIWLHNDTFRRQENGDEEKHSNQSKDVTSGLTFAKDGAAMEAIPSTDSISDVQESDHVKEVQASDQSSQDWYSPAIDQLVTTPSMSSTLQSVTIDDQSCVQTNHVHCERSTRLETRSVIRCGSDLVVSVKMEDPPRDSPAPVTSGGLARGDKPVLDWIQLEQLKQTQETSFSPVKPDKADPNKQQLVCEICTDRASGLHYGIISCEGCKGFFKRTVQNKRVYSCIADGDCQVTKLRRNRCQYCRFKKCLLKGMILAAVRDDRMPGGRNSGAVYSLYKVKYRKPGRSADNNTRKTTAPRRLKSAPQISGNKRTQSGAKSDSTGQALWLQQDLAQGRQDTHSDTCLCHLQQSAAFCSQLIHCANHDSNMSAAGLTVSHDRNITPDMSADMSQDRNMNADGPTVSDGTNMSSDHHFSVSLDRNMSHDSPSVSHKPHMNADNPNVSHYSNMNVDNPTVCYNRNIHSDSPTVNQYLNADSPIVSRYLSADSPTLNQYLSADSPTVSRYLSADSPIVSQYLSADSLTVHQYPSADSSTVSHYIADSLNVSAINGSVRYSDGADMNCKRRSVIADSREIAERQSESNYDQMSYRETTDSRHSNQNNMEDSDIKRSNHLAHIEQLLQCEHAHDLAAATQPYSGAALSTLLRHLSDNVVRELVKWMKTLPFYDRLPLSIHRQCLAEKWYDLLLLTMLAHQACTGNPHDGSPDDVNSHVARNVLRLQHGLRHVLEHEMPVDELYREVGDIVQKLTDIVLNFRKLGLTREEYVCLKVILLLTHESATEVNKTAEHIQGVYRDVLRQLVADVFPHEPMRLTELLLQLPHIQTASALLMKTNTIYIPSMLNEPVQ